MNESNWYKGLFAFSVFKGKHGCDATPDENGETIIFEDFQEKYLAKWIRKQVRDKSDLSPECLYALKHVGFRFPNSFDDRREHTFNELVDFKNSNGHLKVPQNSGPLGKKVQNLRAEHKAYLNGDKSSLTDDYIQKLDNIGFIWVVRENKSWESRYDLLVEYKKEKKNCSVPRDFKVQDVNLGRWVSEQRTQFKKMQNGERSSLTEERITALNTIGFEWSIIKRKPKSK